jgi:alkylation response protein AidB-like acyl-CoA dehydrogenase
MTVASVTPLSETLLEACRTRAAGYDRDNRFCQEDFDELKAAGYLRMAIPKEFGGFGFRLAEVARETRRLAGYAPATALCINMHNYWGGTAADSWRKGDKSVE